MIRQSLDLSPPASFDALFTNLCWVPFTATLTSVRIIFHYLKDTQCSFPRYSFTLERVNDLSRYIFLLLLRDSSPLVFYYNISLYDNVRE